MSFCISCGNPLVDGAKFCSECGAAQAGMVQNNQRRTVYDGEVHKCPNCAEILDSFLPKCPSCGYEFRGVKSVSSVQELASKLTDIEAKRTPKERKLFSSNSNEPDEIDEQKISLISTFPIPNTKEDLYEFLVMAASNIDTDSFKSSANTRERAVSKAWNAKFNQAYTKSMLLFVGDDRLSGIQALNKNIQHRIKKAKGYIWRLLGIVYVVLPLFILMLSLLSNSQNAVREQEEIARLEAIVVDVENALKNGDYKLALMYAETIDYSAYAKNEVQEKKWDAQREYFIEKILDEAAANGVILEYNPKDDDSLNENLQSESDGGSGNPFFDGFIDGFNSAYNRAKDKKK